MYYVCSGQGRLHTLGKITPLTQGDLFFTFPAAPFAIETLENFTYMYISFVGQRGNIILDSLNINPGNFIFHKANQVQPFWENGVLANGQVMELMSEAVLLYTFAFLGNRLLPDSNTHKQTHSVDLIKKYLDDHFSEHNFSLENISRELSYNKKYISTVFKKHFGIGIIDYLNTVRIQNACTMISQGFTSVNDIADRCGYSDAQYFSKIFKAKTGLAPTQYISSLQTKA
jgi:AraC-like DNA-binding protein